MRFLATAARLFACIVSAAASLVCLVSTYATARDGLQILRYGEASNSWPSVVGRVEESFLADDLSENGSVTRAHIKYSYAVNGATYRSSRIGFGDFGAGDPGHAEKLATEYPTGAEAVVYYLDSSPAISTLRRGRLTNPWPIILTSPTVLLMAICFAAGAWALRKGTRG